MRISSVAWLALALAACESEREVNDVTATDTFQQAPNNQVDALFVVDNSASMAEEQAALAAGFESFIGELENSGADFHIGVITTSFAYDDPARGKLIGNPTVLTPADDYVADFQDRVKVGIDGADKERGLEAASYALSPTMTTGPNQGFLRSDAQLLIVFLSDENDCSDRGALDSKDAESCYTSYDKLVPVETFVGEFRDLKASADKIQVSAIVGPKEGGCSAAVAGYRYIKASELTGGFVGDICGADWGAMMTSLGLNASGVRSSFLLSKGAKPETITVQVDGAEVFESPSAGWTYDATTWYLTFHGAAVPARGAEIIVKYTVQAGAQPDGEGTEAP
jgi:hypothetical protein